MKSEKLRPQALRTKNLELRVWGEGLLMHETYW